MVQFVQYFKGSIDENYFALDDEHENLKDWTIGNFF